MVMTYYGIIVMRSKTILSLVIDKNNIRNSKEEFYKLK